MPPFPIAIKSVEWKTITAAVQAPFPISYSDRTLRVMASQALATLVLKFSSRGVPAADRISIHKKTSPFS